MACTILGAVADFGALGLGSVSLVTAVGGGFTLSLNVLFSRFVLKEKMSKTDTGGVLCVVTSAILLAVNDQPHQDLTVDKLFDLFAGKYFIIYCAILGTCDSLLFSTRS